MNLKVATRQKVKLRMSLASPTGFGKTYSALKIAHGITGDWAKIAVIDTEK
jgi:superfamily II DNA or RNA helicase